MPDEKTKGVHGSPKDEQEQPIPPAAPPAGEGGGGQAGPGTGGATHNPKTEPPQNPGGAATEGEAETKPE